MVFGERDTVCVDLYAPNLCYVREKAQEIVRRPDLVLAPAACLPFKSGSFRYILCSEVIEHLQDDDATVAEIGRLLTNDGAAVITAPYTGLGFTSFLELCQIKTVHDY